MTHSEDSRTTCFTTGLEALLPEMRAFARSLCRDVSLADDLVQDACLKAWGSSDKYDPEQPLRPWVFRILRNEFYQKVRRDWRWNTLSDEDQSMLAGESGDFVASLEQSKMCQIIATLPTDQRDALVLVLAAGFTYEEAGKICDCSAGTIKSRVSRARASVRADLEKGTRGQNNLSVVSDLEGLLSQIDVASLTDKFPHQDVQNQAMVA